MRNFRTQASDFGGIEDVFTGFDVNINARLRTGYVPSGRHQRAERTDTRANDCSAIPAQVIDSPEIRRFCDQTFPFRPDVKLLGSHTLPWDVQISGTYQFTRGTERAGELVGAERAHRARARAQSGCRARRRTKLVSLIEPGTVYGENLNQLDLRVSKRSRFDRYRVRVDLDLYNVFNSNWPFTLNNTFATTATSHVAAADQRAAGPAVQDRRAVRFLAADRRGPATG